MKSITQQACTQGVSSDDELHRAQQDLVSATEAAAADGLSSGVSAFAAPALQGRPASDVSQAKDLLGKVLQPDLHVTGGCCLPCPVL